MWRPPSKDKPEKPKARLLPASSAQLSHAKADRSHLVASSYFRDLTRKWAPVVRPKVLVEEQAPEVPLDDPNLPAYLRHRPTSRTKPLFFRTGPSIRGKK